ncbi:unnamed protein product [Prunus armeniaca]
MALCTEPRNLFLPLPPNPLICSEIAPGLSSNLVSSSAQGEGWAAGGVGEERWVSGGWGVYKDRAGRGGFGATGAQNY